MFSRRSSDAVGAATAYHAIAGGSGGFDALACIVGASRGVDCQVGLNGLSSPTREEVFNVVDARLCVTTALPASGIASRPRGSALRPRVTASPLPWSFLERRARFVPRQQPHLSRLLLHERVLLLWCERLPLLASQPLLHLCLVLADHHRLVSLLLVHGVRYSTSASASRGPCACLSSRLSGGLRSGHVRLVSVVSLLLLLQHVMPQLCRVYFLWCHARLNARWLPGVGTGTSTVRTLSPAVATKWQRWHRAAALITTAKRTLVALCLGRVLSGRSRLPEAHVLHCRSVTLLAG